MPKFQSNNQLYESGGFMYQVIGNENLNIIEICIGQHHDHGQHIYMLYIEGERPIYFDNRPIFFFRTDLDIIEKALNLSNCGANKITVVLEEIYYEYDFINLLQSLENSALKYTPDSRIVNCLNILMDYCFDTMDFWTEEKRTREEQRKLKQMQHPNEIQYMEPVSFNTDIKQEYDFVKKIFSAAFYFATATDIDQHFVNEGYDRSKLIQAIKYLVGHIVMSAVYVK
jgi:hypothetical protein